MPCCSDCTGILCASLTAAVPPCPPARPLPPRLSLHRRDGSIYAYAASYDWSRGYSEYNPATAKHHIFLHAPQEVEVKSRNRPAGGARR